MIDITGKVTPGAEVSAPGENKKAAKAVPEKAGQDAPAKKGKTKAGPEKTDKAPTPRKATKDKVAGKTPKEQRDKVSQGKVAPEQPMAGGGSGPGSAPAAKAPAEPTPPPRPVEEGKLVNLKPSELHPFHTFRAHLFKVRDDAKMKEPAASIKANGAMVPGLARPEKDGNDYELIAGHHRHRGSELAGW